MFSKNNPHSISDERDYSLYVTPVTRSFSVMNEETSILRGECSRYDTIMIPAKINVKEGVKLYRNYVATYNFEKMCLEFCFSKC